MANDPMAEPSTSLSKYHTLPIPPKKISRPALPCGDQLHRPCPFCKLESVGDFSIIKMLGSGAYSKVYLADASSHQSPVALKLLLKSIETQSIFENEVSILTRTQHPNIVRMIDHFETNDFYCIVLEHISGLELYEIISNDYSSLSRNDQKEIFKQIVNAIAYLHSIDISHRDIKAENILVKDLKVTLIDFGFAQKIVASNPLSNDRRGSTDYISPEIVMCNPHDPKKSDIWSLGVILFTLLTGSLPFITPTTKKTFHKIARGDYNFPDPISSYPKSAVSLVNALLVTESAKRPSADWILVNDWLRD